MTEFTSSLQLSTILELLEGSFYGMDLLKLHSVTTKLLDRMDTIEKVSGVFVCFLILHMLNILLMQFIIDRWS